MHHETEVPYVYGLPSVAEGNAESGVVSRAMVDYWVAFAVSGTPNDGKGLSSAWSLLMVAWPGIADGGVHTIRNHLAAV